MGSGRSHFLPSKTTHLGCCKSPSNHEISSKASIPSRTLQFRALFFHLLPFSLKTHIQREQASPLIPWNTSISSPIPPSLPIFSSIKQPRSLTKLSSSCQKLAQATPFLFLISSYLPSTNSPQNSLFPLLRAFISHRKPKPSFFLSPSLSLSLSLSLSHAELTNS
ncbi:hypothetical protein GBA52_010662 [Prunus armeniaca]|nr:hypothetical protein GBA52_010662 [Prunus armeniaca]